MTPGYHKHEWRIVPYGTAATKCQAVDCDGDVAACLTWQTLMMPAPAFYYACSKHALADVVELLHGRPGLYHVLGES